MTTAAIPFHRPHVPSHAVKYVQQALASGHTAGDGPFSAAAASHLSALHDGASVLLTPSCTHALELAALTLGLSSGDEVVLPSFTFSSTANALALRGCRLRFAEINPRTFSMELPELEAALTPQTRAVVAVHYGGVARDIDAISALCAARDIQLIEDNAHGLFATSHGQALGTFGALSAVSFHQTKNVACGEGGALVIQDAALLESAQMLREKGTDRTRFLRGEIDKYTWRRIGSSYLLSDMLAAVLLAGLEEAEQTQSRRLHTWRIYAEHLTASAGADGVVLQTIDEHVVHPAHLFALLLPPDRSRSAVLSALHARGVCAASHFEPLHRAPLSPDQAPLPITNDVANRLVRLPLDALITSGQAAHVANTLLRVLADPSTCT